jgi:hypothetical protein
MPPWDSRCPASFYLARPGATPGGGSIPSSSSGLGLWPLELETQVRTPRGSQTCDSTETCYRITVMRCTSCKKKKPTSQFALRNRAKGIRLHICRECKTKYNKGWYQLNKVEHNRRVVKATQAHRRKVAALIRESKNYPCADCGTKYPSYVMDLDHTNPQNKLYNVGQMVGGRHPLTRVSEEISKCAVVCANCHRERTHQRKVRMARSSAS